MRRPVCELWLALSTGRRLFLLFLESVPCSGPISLCLTTGYEAYGGGNRLFRGRFPAIAGEEIGCAGEETGQQSTARADRDSPALNALRGRFSARSGTDQPVTRTYDPARPASGGGFRPTRSFPPGNEVLTAFAGEGIGQLIVRNGGGELSLRLPRNSGSLVAAWYLRIHLSSICKHHL